MTEEGTFTEFDRAMMRRALALARKGRMWVSPNPMVGAVVVKHRGIVGEGYHRRFGGAHAEVEALAGARAVARGATIYVTLEPCAHHGKTPPCADAVLSAGIAKVVMAMVDPFPAVNSRGMRRLREGGVEVATGLLEAEASALNAAYLKRVRTGLPFFTAKWAMSADGRVATRAGESKYLTGEDARRIVHEERSANDAILVGVGTVLADDPLLDSRLVGGRTPLRVVVDSACRTPLEAAMIRGGGPVLIATTSAAEEQRAAALRARRCEVVCLDGPGGKVDLRALARLLGERGLNGVLIEGGPSVLASAFELGLVDRVMVFLAPVVIGGETAPGAVGGEGAGLLAMARKLGKPVVRKVGEDVLVVFSFSTTHP
ncbi:MAG: bifunctional diaminohydroxyphosphoribosylaminopyrimidine deaminase/5-amino-6-(5-phosphoribosylamino)uracil reductase RibD [Planctomycetota bacterium]